MVLARLLGREIHIVQTRCGVAVGIGDQLHQQHAVAKIVGLGHPHTSVGQTIQRIDFGALPGRFAGLAAEFRAFGHGPGLPGVFDLAVFGVVDRLAKTALVGFLVDLGAARVIAAAHDIHHGFLAAHQLANHGVDQSLFNEGLQSWRCFHARYCAPQLRPACKRKTPVRQRVSFSKINCHHKF